MYDLKPKQNLQAAPGDTTRRRSENVWSGCPTELIRNGRISGAFWDSDLYPWPPVLVTPTITTQAFYGNGLKAFGSSGGTLVSGGGVEGGTLVGTETDDNEGIGIAMIDLPFKIINDTYGSFWAEIRLKNSVITDTENGFVWGLWEQQTLSATVPIAAAGTLADANFIGFHRLEGDGDQIDAVYKANGVTQVAQNDDCLHTALVADTYTKLGMKFDAKKEYFYWYQNGIQVASKSWPDAAGTDTPNDVFMGLCFAMLCASSNDSIFTIDWMAAYQSYENAV